MPINSEHLMDKHAQATFLVVRFVAIDRYCKLAMHHASRRLQSTKPLLFSPKLIGSVRRMVGLREKVVSMWRFPQTLYRFYVDGEYYILECVVLYMLSQMFGC